MKLPHVTIEYREDENYAIGRMSAWLIVGLALCVAWSLITLLSGHTLLFPNIADHRELYNNSAVFVYACAFLCYGIFNKRMRELFSTPKRRNAIRLFGTLLMSLSAVLMASANAMPAIAGPAVLIAGFMAGLGCTILTMSFGVSFSVCDIATASMSAGLSFGIAIVVYVLVTKYLAGITVLCGLFCALCPFIEFLCLYKCSRQLVDTLQFADLTIPVKATPFSLHVVLPCLLVGFVISAVRVSMTNSIIATENPAAAFYAALSATGLSLVFIIGAILTQRQRFNFMARTLFPVGALLLASLAFIPQDDAPGIFVFTAAYVLLDCALWVCLSDLSQRFRVSAFISFGLGYGALMMGSFVALMLMGVNGPLNFLMQDHASLTVVALVLLMFGYAFLPNTSEVMDSLDIKGKCPALATEAIELEMLQEPYSPTREERVPDAEARQMAQESAAAAALADKPAPEAQKPPAGREAQAETGAIVEEPPTAPAETGARAEQNSSDAVAQSELEALDERDKEKALSARTKSKNPGRFKRKCAKVAETYLLSRKETEVLFLLAKGRNAAAIQQALYIAPGTTNTHMRHIYRKLDVHSQQELIELVEATELDEENASIAS